eukprot:TRINITY_DN91771_c0_g1_i1.p1 TRINITY_DN91771_c0_g1~~TRINITY_DN91771_c0_g1_i1.p1  ORF type:complete len:316 (-),score=92.06 TRINITY_DN91771_c0_g1_i1:96-1043(-)
MVNGGRKGHGHGNAKKNAQGAAASSSGANGGAGDADAEKVVGVMRLLSCRPGKKASYRDAFVWRWGPATSVLLLLVQLIMLRPWLLGPVEQAVSPFSGDEADFDDFLGKHSNGSVVYFHKSGCHFCERLAPELEAAARSLKLTTDARGGKELPFLSVKADEQQALVRRFGVRKFPVVHYFVEGEPVQDLPSTYRTADKIQEFIEEQGTFPLTQVRKFQEVHDIMKTIIRKQASPSMTIVGLPTSEDVYGALKYSAYRLRAKANFIYVSEASRKLKTPSFISFRGGQKVSEYSVNVPISKQNVLKWVQSNLKAQGR